jgi:spore germination cell wall hydrolase CwlJ-like protein
MDKKLKINGEDYGESPAKEYIDNIVARVIAGEAGGEGEIGMRAVACVIMNRCRQRNKTPKEVVTAPKQFSCLALPEMMERNYQDVKAIADELARAIEFSVNASIACKLPLDILGLEDITFGATNYVTHDLYYAKVHAAWIDKMEVTKVIGRHVFMKERA